MASETPFLVTKIKPYYCWIAPSYLKAHSQVKAHYFDSVQEISISIKTEKEIPLTDPFTSSQSIWINLSNYKTNNAYDKEMEKPYEKNIFTNSIHLQSN